MRPKQLGGCGRLVHDIKKKDAKGDAVEGACFLSFKSSGVIFKLEMEIWCFFS